jgi:hypothetical protein
MLTSHRNVVYMVDKLTPRLKPYGEPIKPPTVPELQVPVESVGQLWPFGLLKSDLVRLIGTFAYQNKVVLDRLRAGGGIDMVLSHCVEQLGAPVVRYGIPPA